MSLGGWRRVGQALDEKDQGCRPVIVGLGIRHCSSRPRPGVDKPQVRHQQQPGDVGRGTVGQVGVVTGILGSGTIGAENCIRAAQGHVSASPEQPQLRPGRLAQLTRGDHCSGGQTDLPRC